MNNIEQKGLPCSKCKQLMKLGDQYYPYQGDDICNSCWNKMDQKISLRDSYYVSDADISATLLFVPKPTTFLPTDNQNLVTLGHGRGTVQKINPIRFSVPQIRKYELPLSGRPIIIVRSKKKDN